MADDRLANPEHKASPEQSGPSGTGNELIGAPQAGIDTTQPSGSDPPPPPAPPPEGPGSYIPAPARGSWPIPPAGPTPAGTGGGYNVVPPPVPWFGPGAAVWPGFGFAYYPPPTLPPVLEPPGRLHPPAPRRRLFSLAGRASPRLYLLGLAVGIPGVAALGWLEIAVRVGWAADLRPFGGWISLEAIAVMAAVGLTAAALAQTRQRHADGWSDYYGASPLLAVALVLALNEAIVTPITVIKTQLDVTWSSGEATLIATLVLFAIYATVVHFLGVRTGALSWHEVVRPKRLAPDASDWQAWPATKAVSRRASAVRNLLIDIGLPMILLIPLIIGTVIVVAILVAILGHDVSGASSPVESTWRASDALPIFIAAALVAPIGEEIFFRGLVTNAWARSLERRQAIIRAGLFFAAIHIYNVAGASLDIALRAAIVAFGGRIIVSLVISWLYIRRHSIVSSAAMHMAYNGTLILIALSAMTR